MPHQPRNKKLSKVNQRCYRCNRNFPNTDECPAKGKTCNFCAKQNHFAAVCRLKQQRKSNEFNNHTKRKEHDFRNQKKKPWRQSVNQAYNYDKAMSSDDEYGILKWKY